MDFNIELTEFPSAVHANIYFWARGVMPLSRTIDAVTDPAMRQSCVALHGFVTDMLSDMYDHPNAWHLPVMKLEEFFGNRPALDMKREFPDKFKKVFAQASHTASQYDHLLFWIGYAGTVRGDAVVVSAERLRDIAKRVSTSVSPIKLDKRMQALGRVGFTMEILPAGKGSFLSQKYPGMFPALCALAAKPNFEGYDFRNINGEHEPAFDDCFLRLMTEQRERAGDLHDYALERKARASLNANWGVDYHYKGKHIMKIGTGDDLGCFLDVKVIVKDRKDGLSVVDKYLEKETPHFREQARRHLTGCDANLCIMCSTYTSGQYVTVLGKRHQMCGTGVIGCAWRNPAQADMAAIKRLIDIRGAIIDEAHAAKKAKG